MRTLILVADADPFNLRLVQEACESLGHDVLTVSKEEQVLDAIARHRPRLLLLDVACPVNAVEIMQVLQADDHLAQLPVIVLTNDSSTDTCQQALKLGALDFIVRPYRVFEIQQRVRHVLGSHAVGGRVSVAPLDMLDELTDTSRADQLRMSLHYEHTRAQRYGHALSCMVIGIVNLPEMAHAGGAQGVDEILVMIAQELRSRLRGADQIFRSHADEFTILLPETDLAGAQALRQRILNERMALIVTASQSVPRLHIGISSYPESSLEDSVLLLKAASQDAYGEPRATMVP